MSRDSLAGVRLFVFGAGYSAGLAAERARALGATVGVTTRDPARLAGLAGEGVAVHRFDVSEPVEPETLRAWLADATHILVSVPPDQGAPPERACPVLAAVEAAGAEPSALRWVGYLSSTAVYGDCGGAWIDETRPPAPASPDARGRVAAEQGWRRFAEARGAALDVLRIAGIYGPGARSALAQVRSGRARAVVRPGHVVNRIHVDDIAGAILAALAHPEGFRLTNLADDTPAPTVDVLDHAAALLGLPPPPRAEPDASGPGVPGTGFLSESRRIRNDRLKALPGFVLKHPGYREGLAAILAAEGAEP